MDGTEIERINTFVQNNKHLSRSELDKGLKKRFNVHLQYRRYLPHTGLKQRVKNLMKTGLTRNEAFEQLIKESENEQAKIRNNETA